MALDLLSHGCVQQRLLNSPISSTAGTLYDELEPRQLLESRTNEDGTKDYLVQWPDDAPDSWVSCLAKHWGLPRLVCNCERLLRRCFVWSTSGAARRAARC